MKLKQFINELEVILKNVDDPDAIEVRMADYIPVVSPVVSPILGDKTVFITDVEGDEE